MIIVVLTEDGWICGAIGKVIISNNFGLASWFGGEYGALGLEPGKKKHVCSQIDRK